ncbi:MAG: hypothetical protein J6K14_03195 [Clostridia bacterium]|nr:hypothetical protein [Clostridia bacterium]
MKKYISIVLCLACFVTAVLINYDAPMAGKGKGTSETVTNMEELATVIDGVVAMTNMEFLSGTASASEPGETSYDSVTFGGAYEQSATITCSSQVMQMDVRGEETWYIDNGGDRLYLEGSGDINMTDNTMAENNYSMSLGFAVYYDKDAGWFIKYNYLQMPGAEGIGVLLDKWISLDSFSGIMDMSELFSQLLGKTYGFFTAFEVYINEQRDTAFGKNGTLYTMNKVAFEAFAHDQYSQSPDMTGLGVVFGELNAVDGFLKVDLSESERPSIDLSNEMDYDATIDGMAIHYLVNSEQQIYLTNINNTVVPELDPSTVYDLGDLM